MIEKIVGFITRRHEFCTTTGCHWFPSVICCDARGRRSVREEAYEHPLQVLEVHVFHAVSATSGSSRDWVLLRTERMDLPKFKREEFVRKLEKKHRILSALGQPDCTGLSSLLGPPWSAPSPVSRPGTNFKAGSPWKLPAGRKQIQQQSAFENPGKLLQKFAKYQRFSSASVGILD